MKLKMALVAGSLLMELTWTYRVASRFFQNALLHFNSFDWPICGLPNWLTKFRFTVHAGSFLNVITSRPVMRSTYPKLQVWATVLLEAKRPQRDAMKHPNTSHPLQSQLMLYTEKRLYLLWKSYGNTLWSRRQIFFRYIGKGSFTCTRHESTYWEKTYSTTHSWRWH